MAIRIIEGNPGSGKSFYAMRHLVKTYFIKKPDGSYVLNPDKEVLIITNIDRFKPPHINLVKLLHSHGGVKVFFDYHYQKAFTQCLGKNIIYVIDEAQKLFRKNDRELNDVFGYFEEHRHIGHDVYLITQNAKKLPADISLLTEFIVVACPRTRSVFGEFKYKWLSDGDIIKREGFRPEKAIFDLYCSMDVKETEKIKNPVMITVGIMLLSVAVMIGLGIWYFKHKWLAVSPDVPVSSSSSVIAGKKSNSPGLVINKDSLVTVSVSVITETVNRGGILVDRQLYLVGGHFVQKSDFPYVVRRVAGQWLARVPFDIAMLLKPVIDDSEGPVARRNESESASVSAHGQQDPAI